MAFNGKMFYIKHMLIADSATDIVGTIKAPVGVDKFNAASIAAGSGNIGLIIFISNLIRLATIIAGIWVLFNFVTAGYTYITSQGEAKAADQVKNQITSSVLGLIIIVAAYTVIAIISFLLFGDAGFILNPSIPTT